MLYRTGEEPPELSWPRFGEYILRNSEGVQPFIILNIRMKADMLVKPLAIATSVTDSVISERDRSARVILF